MHMISNLCNIYIFTEKINSSLLAWTKTWSKIKEMYTSIQSICYEIVTAVKQDNQEITPLSITPAFDVISNTNLDRLEPSFMYTKLFKETLLEMHYDK